MSSPSKPQRILAVDDDADALFVLSSLLEQQGYQVITARNGAEGVMAVKNHRPDLALFDVSMPVMSGIEATAQLKADPELRFIPLVLLSANQELADVLKGLSAGADDYLAKPYRADELVARVHAVLRTKALYQELQHSEDRNLTLRKQLSQRAHSASYGALVSNTAGMREIFEVIEKIKDAPVPVLINGESGTGKELIAQAIHSQGNRSEQPFIAQNCSAFSESLLESELFGHTKGAFTGAVKDRQGLFELADGGTLFLDEIGEMKPALQAKLLRVLQEGVVTPVGATDPIKVSVRVIAATHRDIEQMIAAGTFREDLFYRLNVIRLKLPPLRERLADIPALCEHLLKKFADRLGAKPKQLSPELLEALSEYRWPGNVRELENELQRMVLLSGDDTVIPVSLFQKQGSFSGTSPRVEANGDETLPDAIARVERELITSAMRKFRGNKSEVARVLGISRSNLIAKVQSYGVAETEGE